ncbi:MAG: filamentous hemagglutinin N-terminal domain-containing protein [Burkholderiaceae bacterium]
MNSIYRSIWNDNTGTFVAVSENANGAGKKTTSGTGTTGTSAILALKILAASLMMAFGAHATAAPVGGVVAAGGASISSGAGSTTINQTTQNAAINWQSFDIGAGEAVRFVQPNSRSVALNRVLGSNPSSILGSLSANGKVFLVNPNGVLFGKGASVNVGGLVASTLNISDSDFMAGNYKFAGTGGTVLNQGTINADGGYVALLGANVSNQGVISAQLGTVALAAGNAVTLDVAGDGLLNVAVNQAAADALVQNGGMIQADGGKVLMTTQAAGSLLSNAVNNTGVVRAQTIENRNGTIMLLAGMQTGTVNVGGTLDASAPNGGKGGFIETSAANVRIANDAKVTTAAAQGQTGTWLIDPQDFIIGSAPGNNITGATLGALLVTNSVIIDTATGIDATNAGSTPPVTGFITNTAASGNGDIKVNEAVSWTAISSPTTLTLKAVGDINIDGAITATNGNLVACCGQDINVRAAVKTTNGSVSLSAGRDVNVEAAMTTVNGNMALCAGRDVNVNAPISLTDSGSIPAQSLGLPLGLTLSAGNAATGPGIAGGTVRYGAGILTTLVRAGAPALDIYITYNPVSYSAPTDFSGNFTRDPSRINLFPRMLVFPDGGSKTYDGTTTANLSGLKGNPGGVTLTGAGTANFDTSAVGTGKTITYSGFSLGGANASNFALPVSCCAPAASKTSADINPAIVTPPAIPVVTPPVVRPPVVTPPSETLPSAGPTTLPVIEAVPPGPAPTRFIPPAVALVVVPPAALPPPVLVVVAPPETPVEVPPATPVVVPPVPRITPPEQPPTIYVMPRPPKQDRN